MSDRKQPVRVGACWSESAPCPEMLSVFSEPGIEIVRITTDPAHDAHCAGMNDSHALFTPDSRRAILIREVGRGSDKSQRLEFLLCELEDGFSLRRLTDDPRPAAPVLSRDGRHFYFLANPDAAARETGIALKRVDLRTFETETLTVFEAPVEGIGKRPLDASSSGSLRADGRMICSGFNFRTDNGATHFAPVFIDLETLSIHGFDWEPYNWRVGGTYYRGDDPARRDHVLMVRSNRSQHWDPDRNWAYSETWYSDVHFSQVFIVNESGAIQAIAPIGDGRTEMMDHPCWRGGRYEVVTHSGRHDTAPHWRGTMMTAEPVVCDPTLWNNPKEIPGARRVELTRRIIRPDVCHHAWDHTGARVVADIEGWHPLMGPAAHLWIGTVKEQSGEDPYVTPKFLLNPRSTWTGNYATQSQPAMSSDCRTILFNSDWLGKTGHSQVFAVRGFQFP